MTPESPVHWIGEFLMEGSDQWCGTGLCFATREEATAYIRHLTGRLILAKDTRVVSSLGLVNAAWRDGRLAVVKPL